MTLWPHLGRWLRPLLIAYPLAMAFSVVFTGEHYVLDVILGWIYVAGVLMGFRLAAPARGAALLRRAPVAHSAAG